MSENTKPAPILVEWETGRYELSPVAVPHLAPATLKKIMKQATKHPDETAAEVRACIEAARKAGQHDKKERARLGKLLEVLEPAKKKNAAGRVAERIVKRMGSASYAGVFHSGGWNCVCDGYVLLCLPDTLDLPTVPGGIDAAKAIDEAAHNAAPLALPSLAEVKSFQRIAKSAPRGAWLDRIYPEKSRTLFDFGTDMPLVDLALLRDVLEALPDARACWTTPSAPLVFTAPNGQALLCPVKPVGNAGATRSAAPVEIEQPAAQRPEIISKPRKQREKALTPGQFAAQMATLAPIEFTPEEFAASLAA